MRRWDQLVSDIGGRWTYADLSADERDIRVFGWMSPFQGTSAEPYKPEVALTRAICHLFVERMPERALPELAEAMARTFEFYYDAPRAPIALSPEPFQPVRGKVGKTYERPPFNLPDE